MSDSEEDQLNDTLEYLAKQLEDNYQLKTINKFGGQGGFGLVLFVQDANNESQKYAVKAQSIINPTTGNVNQSLLKQCKEEAMLMKQCKHQNIVEIYSDFVLGFYHFIQMRLCKQSLNDWIMKNGKNPISDQVFCKFVQQMVEGLEYLHNKDYVLRDVSVRNILLTAEDEVKFCDFGLARKYDSDLRSKILYTSHINGVIYYFPPEIHQAIQEQKPQIKQTKEGDIWALGVCLSILGGIPISHFSNSFHEDFRIIDAPNISQKANLLIKKILIKDHKKRPSFKQINEYIYQIFSEDEEVKENQDIQLIPKKNEEKTLISDYQHEEYKNNSYVQEDQQETAVVFVNKQLFEKKINEIPQQNLLNSQINESETKLEFNFLEAQDLYQKYNTVQNQNSDNIEILLFLGHLEIKLNCNFERGQSYLQKVITLQQNNMDAYLSICESYLMQKSFMNLEQIEKNIQFCLTVSPSYWRIFYIQSWLFYEQESYIESEKSIFKAQLQIPQSPVLNSLHALILVQKNFQNLNLSQDEIKKSIEFNSLKDPIVLSRAGLFYQQYMKQFNKAQECYIKALSICPKELMSLSNLVILFDQQKEMSQLQYYKQQLKTFYSDNGYANQILGRVKKDQEKKIKYFQKSIDIDPFLVSSYFYLSEIKKYQKKFNEVEEIQKLTLQINPKAASACIELGNIYLHRNDRKSAQEYISRAQQLDNKQECDSLYLEGLNYELKEQDELALKHYYESINKNPIQERSYQRIVKILQLSKFKNYDEIIKITQKALIYNPINESFKLQKIQAHIEKKQFQEAKSELMDLIIINPKRIEIYERLAYIENVYFNDKDQAILYYQKELEINQSETSMVHLVNIYLEKSQFQLAEEHLQKFLQIFPNSLELRYSKAILLKSLNKIEEAMNIFKDIISTNPLDFRAYNELGFIYQTYKTDYNEAVKYYGKSLELNNAVTSVYYNIAIIYIHFKNYEYSEKMLKQYLQYFSNDYKAYFDLGQIYYHKNELPLAASYFQRTVQIQPNHEQAYYLLSQISKRENRYQEAINYLKIVRQINTERIDALLDLANLYSSQNPTLSCELFQQYLQKYPLDKDALKSLNLIANGQLKINLEKQVDQIKDKKQQLIMLKQIQLLSHKPSVKLLDSIIKLQVDQELFNEAEITIIIMQKYYPSSGLSYLHSAEIQIIHHQNYTQSIEYLKKAQSLYVEEESLVYLYYGFAYWKLKEISKAIKCLKKSVSKNQNQSLSLFYLAQIEMEEKKDFKKAISYLNQCIKDDFCQPKVYFALGKSFEKLNYVYQAKEAYEKVLEVDSNYVKAEECRSFITQNPNPEKLEYKEKCSIF